MQAILFICHGSRIKHSCEEASTFIENCRSDLQQYPIVEYCFLELASPNIAEGFQNCIRRGATRVAVIPFLLLTAVHAIYDIPEELKKMKELYSEVQILYGNPIGVSKKMSQLLLEKISEAQVSAEDTQIVIVGRGSRMEAVKVQLETIVAEVRLDYENTTICYLTACEPTFEDSLEAALQGTCTNVLIIPYLIFPGILTETIVKTVQEKNIHLKKVIISSPLGTHSNVKEALLDRVAEIV